MMGVLAELERSIIQERVRACLERAHREGKRLGRLCWTLICGKTPRPGARSKAGWRPWPVPICSRKRPVGCWLVAEDGFEPPTRGL
jgi:hypothetical protein